MNKNFISLINSCFETVGGIPAFTITSSYRTQADQERLKREGYDPHPQSFHLTGQALDIVFNSLLDPWKFGKCNFLDSIYYPVDGHWHFEPKQGQVNLFPMGISEYSYFPVIAIVIVILAVYLLLQ